MHCTPPHYATLIVLRSSLHNADCVVVLLIALCWMRCAPSLLRSSCYTPPHCTVLIILRSSSLCHGRCTVLCLVALRSPTTLLLIPSHATLLLIPGFTTVFLIPCYGTLFLIPRCTTLLLVPRHGTHLFIIFPCFSSFLVALRYLLCASPHSSLCQLLTTSGHLREKSFDLY